MHLPTIKQLRYLIALHEHQNFSRAAEACNVTQSAFSAAIKDLEAALSAQLVERTRRMVVFTPLGEQTVRQAHELLRIARTLGNPARADAPLSGPLRLGIIPSIAPFLLPRILPPLLGDYPDLELSLREDVSAALCAALARGDLDCVILALPFECGAVEHEALFDDPLLLAFHRDDPVVQGVTLAPGGWRDRLLLLPDGHCLRDHALAVCGRGELDALDIHPTSLHTLVHLIDNRLGVTLLPWLAVEGGLLSGTQVVTWPLPDARRQVVLAWRPGGARAGDYRRLAALIRQTRGEAVL